MPISDSTALIIDQTHTGSPLIYIIICLIFVLAILVRNTLPRWIAISAALLITAIQAFTTSGVIQPIALPAIILLLLVGTLVLLLIFGLIARFLIGSPWRLRVVATSIFNSILTTPEIQYSDLFTNIQADLKVHKLNKNVFQRAIKLLEAEGALRIEEETKNERQRNEKPD